MWNPFKKKEKSDAEKLTQHIKEIPLEELTGLFDGLNELSEINNLYSELSRLIHPDRFPNDEVKRHEAESLFKEVQSNRTNKSKLIELKKKAEQLINS